MTKTEIVNKALTLIGASPITSLTDDTNNARIMNRVYDSSLRSILSECLWNFATKRRLLATSAETLAWYDTGVTLIYAKPADCIRIFGTNDDAATWKEEGDLIMSDTSGLGVKYVYYLDDPSKYPASFVDAFVDRLAYDSSFMVTNSKQVAEIYMKKYEQVSLPKARSENAQVGVQQYVKDDAWELAKYNNSNINA